MELLQETNGRIDIGPQVRQIAEFDAIIKSDRNKNKAFSKKVFSYLYFMYDYKSPYFAYQEKARHQRVLDDLSLGELKMTDKVKAAVRKFRELRETPSIRILNESRETLQTSVDVIKVLRQEIDNAILDLKTWQTPETLDKDSTYTAEEMKEVQSAIRENLSAKQDLIKNSVDNLKNLLSLSDKIPNSIKTLQELEEKVKKEESGEERIKGGGKKGLYED